jgi:hypothetical protein
MNIFEWFRSLIKNKDQVYYKRTIFVDSIVDVPKDPGSTIFVIADNGKQKWVAFRCPDGCGRRVEVNLMSSSYPRWRIFIRNGKVSISPSIVVKGCGSHFYLTENEILWARFEDEL